MEERCLTDMVNNDAGFRSIRIAEAEYQEITKRVRHERKMYEVVRDAMIALKEKEERQGSRDEYLNSESL
jgi:hypothetical protein